MPLSARIVRPLAVLLAMALVFPALAAEDEALLELAERSRCLTCHDLQEKLRCPPWREVAARYRGDSGAEERLVAKVRDGGSGNWGDEVMSPNRRVGDENIRKLVRWILTLK